MSRTPDRLVPLLRSILRRSSEPQTVSALSQRVDKRAGVVVNALHRMPDAYIADWKTNHQNRDVMCWAVVKVPPHAPRPPLKKQAKS